MSLLQMSFAGAVMILIITLIRALALHRVPKETFRLLWGVALVRLLIPFSFSSGISIYSLLKQNAAPAIAEKNTVAVFPTLLPGNNFSALPQIGSVSGAGFPLWTAVWGIGAFLLFIIFAAAYLKCYQEFQISFPVENKASRRWLQTHTLQRQISIRQSDRISSPLTFGILHPVILMPKRTNWKNETALQYVLEHEFVHIRRFDAFSKLLFAAAVCVHWFNPFVWLMYVLANRDIELSCDEAVVHHFGYAEKSSYAKVLIYMEEEKSCFAPFCNHFSKNAIEERITAIMKTKKITIVSLAAAVLLVAGTVTVFATSAKPAKNEETLPMPGSSESYESSESGEAMKPSAEYSAAGITEKNNFWYYQETPIASIYDDNGDIYTNAEATEGIDLHIERDNAKGIKSVTVITKEQLKELIDRYRNTMVDTTADKDDLLSYSNLLSYTKDGKTYYSFDDGQTFEPLTEEEFEARFPTPNVEWWTYDEYKAWLEQEKANLQSIIGSTGWSGGEEFTWTQKKIDETIALYEEILENIKNGMMYSKFADGQEDFAISYNPADTATSTDKK